MKFVVLEEIFWQIRGTEGVFYFKEEDEKVKLWLSQQGVMFYTTHYREDALVDDEEASQSYLIWKDEHLTQGIPVLEYKEGGVTIKTE